MTWHDDYMTALKGDTIYGTTHTPWDSLYRAALQKDAFATPATTGNDWGSQYVAALQQS